MLSVKKTIASTIGFPRIGPAREMKKGLEDFWAKKTTADELLAISRSVEELAWTTQVEAGIDLVALDGTLYDHVLDAVYCLGLLPERFNNFEGLDRYFAAARGAQSAPALDMSKFMDTNYHYLCPEFTNNTLPTGSNWDTYIERTIRAQSLIGRSKAVPMIIGPLTLVSLANGDFDRSEMIRRLVPCYNELLVQLHQLQVPEVQVWKCGDCVVYHCFSHCISSPYIAHSKFALCMAFITTVSEIHVHNWERGVGRRGKGMVGGRGAALFVLRQVSCTIYKSSQSLLVHACCHVSIRSCSRHSIFRLLAPSLSRIPWLTWKAPCTAQGRTRFDSARVFLY